MPNVKYTDSATFRFLENLKEGSLDISLIWLMFGFSLTAYADSWFMWKLFKPYFKEEEEGHHYVDTEPDQYAF